MWVKKDEMDRLKEHVENLNAALKDASNRTTLLDITTEGKKLKFIFVRNNELFEIETMRLMSDHVKKWKENLLR